MTGFAISCCMALVKFKASHYSDYVTNCVEHEQKHVFNGECSVLFKLRLCALEVFENMSKHVGHLQILRAAIGRFSVLYFG